MMGRGREGGSGGGARTQHYNALKKMDLSGAYFLDQSRVGIERLYHGACAVGGDEKRLWRKGVELFHKSRRRAEEKSKTSVRLQEFS